MTRTRPTLLPGLRRLWRDRNTLQVGLDPARGLVVELADPGTARLLALLDGARPERALLADAAAAGIDPADARNLLAALRGAGLVVGAHTLAPGPHRQGLAGEIASLALDGSGHRAAHSPAQLLRRRSRATVVVTGRGRLGPPIALGLAAAGVGHVTPDLAGAVDPADALVGGLVPAGLGAPRSAAVTAAIARHAPGTRTAPPAHPEQITLIVDADAPGPASVRAARYARHGHAYLAVTVQEGRAMIGPLVPGTRAEAACLNCLELHRRDHDPAWPALAAQLAAADPGTDPCAVPTLFAAAGLAVAETLNHLDGRPPVTLGAAVEIDHTGRQRRRSWPPHPRCDCRNPVREPAGRRSSVTMIR
ncbi:hypothetical protein [Rhizomonospora bruguierae]|uniref:hypothetical protein n=1 Tax=Rhizomonospora bruguierae TaxID=1581705 RepID=UPI001BD14CB7|nr:hypothetical protein [Micromonospora sp. NBRC 107566]